MKKRGRPRLANNNSQIPAIRVPTALHDAVVIEALERDVSVAQVVREAIFLHLKNRRSLTLVTH